MPPNFSLAPTAYKPKQAPNLDDMLYEKPKKNPLDLFRQKRPKLSEEDEDEQGEDEMGGFGEN